MLQRVSLVQCVTLKDEVLVHQRIFLTLGSDRTILKWNHLFNTITAQEIGANKPRPINSKLMCNGSIARSRGFLRRSSMRGCRPHDAGSNPAQRDVQSTFLARGAIFRVEAGAKSYSVQLIHATGCLQSFLLMSKVSDSSENHRDIMFVRGVDDFSIPQ